MPSKPGRPRDLAVLRDRQINFRVSRGELRTIRAKAKRLHMTCGELLRVAVVAYDGSEGNSVE